MDFLFGAAVVVIVALLYLTWRLTRRTNAQELEHAELEAQLAALEQERASSQELWSGLTRATSDGIVRVDENGSIVYVNDAARALLGIRDHTKGSLRHLAWGYDFDSLVRQVLSEGSGRPSQTIVKDERTFQVRAVAVGDADKRGVLLALTEVTELQRLGRARREFVANISHELRTPVTSLQLLAETMNQEVLNDRALLNDLLDKMRAQVDLLKQLTDELMDLALIESGQAPIKLVEVFAGDLVMDALLPLRPQAERKQIKLDAQIPPDIQVLADPQAIRKVISNLTHNALKFTPEGGSVTLHATWCNDGSDVEFAIQDTGVGIPEKDLSRIFERFYKVDRARTRTQGELRGTGLGLAIAKHIVEAHGGKIWAESVQGKGSTFYFTLPSGE
ncbi:MAG: PAS domain-containing protein [Chloroflexi bacterium]|nr:PAS domain-containing protein [Chloroflexota bacterium]